MSKMEEEKIAKIRYPWPSRLANWSCQCGMWGLIFLAIGIVCFFGGYIPYLGFLVTYGFAWLIFFFIAFHGAFVLSFVALLGMVFYRFKVPRIGRAVSVFIPAFIVFIMESIFLYWGTLEARKLTCANNMRELTMAVYLYREEKGCWPDKEHWNDLIAPYLPEGNWFQCPADKTGPCSYAMNEYAPSDANEVPGDFVLLFESAPGWNQVGGVDDVVTDRHRGCWIGFGDFSRDFAEPEDIRNLRWTVEDDK